MLLEDAAAPVVRLRAAVTSNGLEHLDVVLLVVATLVVIIAVKLPAVIGAIEPESEEAQLSRRVAHRVLLIAGACVMLGLIALPFA